MKKVSSFVPWFFLIIVSSILLACQNSDYKLQSIEYYEKQGLSLAQFWHFSWENQQITEIRGCEYYKPEDTAFVFKFLYKDDLVIGTKLFRYDTLICESSYTYDGNNIVKVAASYYNQDNSRPTFWQYMYEDGKIVHIIFDTLSKCVNGHGTETLQNIQLNDSIFRYRTWENLSFMDKADDKDSFYWMSSDYWASKRCSSITLRWKDENICFRQDCYRKYYYQKNECKLSDFYLENSNQYFFTDKTNPFRLPQGVGHELQYILSNRQFDDVVTLWSLSFHGLNNFNYSYEKGYPIKGEFRDVTIIYSYIK